MKNDSRFIVRRTVSQELFEILWRKYKAGEATLRDFKEMDEIINRDPLVRQFVLQEMENDDSPAGNGGVRNFLPRVLMRRPGFGERLKAFFDGIFNAFVRVDWSV